MTDFNNDQQKQTQQIFEQQEDRRQELFQADQEREQQFFRDQTQQQEAARQADLIRQEQGEQSLDRDLFQSAVQEWDRPDLAEMAQQKFEVGDKVNAAFSNIKHDDDSLQFSKQGAAFETGQAEVTQVEIVATAQLTQKQFASAFDDYSNEPQAFLQGHSGLTQDGVQKAVAVSAPGQATVVVVPNQQGQAQSFGFAPRPALVQLAQEQQVRRAETSEQRAESTQQNQAQSAKPEPLNPQRFTSNAWGSEGISDRWSRHESAQHELQRNIQKQKHGVSKTEEQVRELLKSREQFLKQTEGMSQDDIKKDPALAAGKAKFDDQGKALESAMKNLKEQSADLAKTQNQYALNHAAFQADSWGRVRTGGEVMGSQETIRMASRKQDEFKAEMSNINARLTANPLSKDAQKMTEQFEQQKQQSPQQQAPSAAKTGDLSLSTTDYMRSQHAQAREQGAKVVVMPEKNQHALSKLGQIQAKAKEAAEAIAKAKEEQQKKDQQQGQDPKKSVRQ